MADSTFLYQVALLGRPNVGKSTLFNRLIKSNRAITHDMPGITRDRMEGTVKRRGQAPFRLVDTGGVTLDSIDKSAAGPDLLRGFEEDILAQAKEAVAGAHLLCLVVDGREGLTPFDTHLADFLRRTGKPLVLLVNKVDGPEKADLFCAEFHSLGIPLISCSAAHGYNIQAVEDAVYEHMEETLADMAAEAALHAPALKVEEAADTGDTASLAAEGDETDVLSADGTLRLALLGKPNAGKSSLVNALVGAPRMIVSDVPGTTRDSVDVHTVIHGVPCTFVDTAGVRRRAKVVNTVERYSVNSSLKTTTKAHVTLLVVSAEEGITQQDKRLIELLVERRTPFMVLVNKADLISPQQRKQVERDFKDILIFCPHIPILFISALRKKNIAKIVPLARDIRKECYMRVGTGILNRSLEAVLHAHQPPIVKNARPKFFYMTQAETTPPTFVFFVSDAERILPSYGRYLEKALRKLFGITHAPMRLHFRSSHKKKK